MVLVIGVIWNTVKRLIKLNLNKNKEILAIRFRNKYNNFIEDQ